MLRRAILIAALALASPVRADVVPLPSPAAFLNALQQAFAPHKKKVVKKAAKRVRKPVAVSRVSKPTKRAKPPQAARAGSKTASPATETYRIVVKTAEPRGKVQAMVVAQAKAEGLPKGLAYAVAKHESGFNPRATGRANEIGVFQIKCSSARSIGYTGTCRGLYDASTNIKWGVRYLAIAHKLSGGNTCGTLSRYNGGHGRKTRIRSYCRAVLGQ